MALYLRVLGHPGVGVILAWACALAVAPCAAQVTPTGDAELATADAGSRVELSLRPAQPMPQHPLPSTPENVDTHKPPELWQRGTDDWLGARPWLEDRGVSMNASLSLDISRSFRGGATTHDWAAGWVFNANLTLDTQRLMNLYGGTLFVNFQQMAGSPKSVDGALQNASEASQEGRTQISELWYEQRIGEWGRLKVGKMDADTEFCHVEAAEDFLNGGLGQIPTVFGLPTHPDTAVGVNAFFNPTENLYAGFGLYDGSGVAGRRTGAQGLAISHVPNLFWIGEAGGTWSLAGGREGRIGVGVWHVTGEVPRFDGGQNSGATGPYAFFEQTLWRAKPEDGEDDRGVAMFLQYGQAGGAYSSARAHAGGGMTWTGPIAGRELDVAGLGISWAALGKDAGFLHRNECAIEGFYRVRVTRFLSIKPDVQYIHHPAEAARDCWVGSVQIVVDF